MSLLRECPYKWRFRKTHRRKHCEDKEIGEMCLQAKELQGLPATGRQERGMGWDELSLRDLCSNQPCSHIDFGFLNQVLLFWATQFVAIGYSNPRKRIHLHIYSVNCLSPSRAPKPEVKFCQICSLVFPRAETQYVPNIYLLHTHRLSA